MPLGSCSGKDSTSVCDVVAAVLVVQGADRLVVDQVQADAYAPGGSSRVTIETTSARAARSASTARPASDENSTATEVSG